MKCWCSTLKGELRQIVPDNMVVVVKEPTRAEGSFNLPLEPAGPFFVLEYVSVTDPAKDYEDRYHKYERELRVPYCLLFHPHRQDLRVYRHGGRRYKLLKPNAVGRIRIPELDLELGLRDGWVRFWYRGQLLELPAELQHRLDITKLQLNVAIQQLGAAKQEVDATKQQLDVAKAEVERLRALVEQLTRKK